MKSIICAHCKEKVLKNPRCPEQKYCGKPECRKARRKRWQKQKIDNDPIYKANQKQNQKDWIERNEGYWKKYRKYAPKYTERNRILQRVRNQGLNHKKSTHPKLIVPKKIAKMDSLESSKINLSGAFWLVPKIAKMDSLMVLITDITDNKNDVFNRRR